MHHGQHCRPAAGTLALTRALLPLLRKGVRRTVVNLSSGAGAISAAGGQGGWALRSLAYKASKAALNMGALRALNEYLAQECASAQQLLVCLSLSQSTPRYGPKGQLEQL